MLKANVIGNDTLKERQTRAAHGRRIQASKWSLDCPGVERMQRRIRDMIWGILGCWHRNISRPFTISDRTYQVCLNCGKQFAYIRIDFRERAPHGAASIHLE